MSADHVHLALPFTATAATTRKHATAIGTTKHVRVQNAKCHTTHCFIKGKSKTIQIYKSLAYGAYILTAEYIKDSLAAGQWVSSSSGVVLV